MPTELSSSANSAGATATAEVLPLEHALRQRPATSSFRWVILGLIFLGTTINYVDRQVINILSPYLMEKYTISKVQWGNIGAAFAWSYAFGQLIAGGMLDRVGVRIGYPLGLAVWSLVSIAHAGAVGFGSAIASALGLAVGGAAVGFGVMRGLLGVAEAPNFPAVTKTLSEWFPKKERAFGMGFINAGTNIGILIALLVVEPITRRWGWQWAFVVTGSLGLLWLLVWIPIYRRPEEHSWVSRKELAYINGDPPEPTTKLPWRTLLGYKQAWAFAVSKFITDAMWWFYMVWFADFLYDKYKLDLKHIGLPLIVVYLMADVGSILGGWLSSTMIHRGFSTNAARKTALSISAVVVTPIMFAAMPKNPWISVILLGFATAGHQGFSSNLYTLVSDTFPRRAVAGVAGLGGTFGYIGAALFSTFTGYVLFWTGNRYSILFVIAGCGYLVSFGIIQLLMPRLEPALVEDRGFPVGPVGR
jgi:ACS family hexuronate transporter-like MFS transporter